MKCFPKISQEIVYKELEDIKILAAINWVYINGCFDWNFAAHPLLNSYWREVFTEHLWRNSQLLEFWLYLQRLKKQT